MSDLATRSNRMDSAAAARAAMTGAVLAGRMTKTIIMTITSEAGRTRAS